MCDYEKNVFINCPYDEDYRLFLVAITFMIVYLGYCPRLALENSDSGETRIDKIVRLIKDSKYSIHDLSRLVSSDAEEYYRLNMPFELGMDFGCRKLLDGKFTEKRFLILESELYRYRKALSDLSGVDIKAHKNDLYCLFRCLRDWFVENTHQDNILCDRKLVYLFFDFQEYLLKKAEKLGFSKDDFIEKLTIVEIINCAKTWSTK